MFLRASLTLSRVRKEKLINSRGQIDLDPMDMPCACPASQGWCTCTTDALLLGFNGVSEL